MAYEVKTSGMEPERPLETYSPDELLDMLREAGHTLNAAMRRRAEIQNAVQNKLDRIGKEFMAIQEQHYGEGEEKPETYRSEYRNGGQH